MSPQRTSTTMELLPLVCLCLLSCSGDAVRVEVIEGSDAVLPCLISTENLEGNKFDWKKDGQKDVFMYDAGIHYNNGRPGQDEQFKGRVSHFQDQLQNGDASIKITRTMVADSGNYSCDFPRLQPRQTSIIELVVDPRVEVFVKEDSDAVLPCSPDPKVDLTGQVFDWKKDDQKEKKEVFLHGSDGHTTQGPDFTERVSHFQDQLKNGSASIKIHRVKKTDRGIYSCHFPHLQSQTFFMKLVVGAFKPYVTIVRTDDERMLQCEVLGASPKPKVEWKDSSGNILPVKDLKETERGDSYDIVLQTALTKTDTFACVVTQEEFSHQIYAEIDAAVIVPPPKSAVRVIVEESSDAVLPCLISTEDLEGNRFDWKKDGQKEVFLYDAGIHYNNGRPGQDEQFKGRVSHFQDQLQNGDASIKITRTKMADSGIYSCDFPRLQPRQTSIIELVVGAAPEPTIHRPRDTKDSSLLQCEAHGVPPLTVEWKDSVGNILKNESTPKSEKGDRSSITLNITVTKTDNYRCVATQKKISHQIFAETSVYIQGAAPEPGWSGWWVAGFIVVSLFLVGGVVFHFKDRIRQIYVECVKKNNVKEPDPEAESLKQHDSKSEKKSDGEKTDPAAKPLNPPEKNPGSTPNAANGQPDTEENTAV